MPFSPKTLEKKPYNACINCAHIGENCDGPNFFAMENDRLYEWCHIRKDYLGWTNAEIAELSGLSEVTVARIISGNVKDPRINTLRAVLKALVNGSWGQYPCAMAALGEKEEVYVDNPELIEEIKRLKAMLEALKAEHKTELTDVKASEQRKVDYLRCELADKKREYGDLYKLIKQRNRVVLSLSIMLGLALSVIVGTIIIDWMNPDIGFLLNGNILSARFNFIDQIAGLFTL